MIAATATRGLQRGCHTTGRGAERRLMPYGPSPPPPMEKQKWGGQDSGVAALQEKMDAASCGEE